MVTAKYLQCCVGCGAMDVRGDFGVEGLQEEVSMAKSKEASDASKTMRDPKASHEEKSKAASEMGKSKGKGSPKKK